MNEEQRKALREKQEACSHPSTSKEYYLGSNTGDRVCDHCGLAASPDYFKKKENE